MGGLKNVLPCWREPFTPRITFGLIRYTYLQGGLRGVRGVLWAVIVSIALRKNPKGLKAFMKLGVFKPRPHSTRVLIPQPNVGF